MDSQENHLNSFSKHDLAFLKKEASFNLPENRSGFKHLNYGILKASCASTQNFTLALLQVVCFSGSQ